ncbi:unnamed protein product [Cylicocyclus nassatus]|uniref:Fucosyltransferase n=1 Tax=Cylicocyclus nassatus TaxID=53992 RepID=A0AA36M945_CYLNA|nr:unnamed protein product [Cylicocyclus nassatus]
MVWNKSSARYSFLLKIALLLLVVLSSFCFLDLQAHYMKNVYQDSISVVRNNYVMTPYEPNKTYDATQENIPLIVAWTDYFSKPLKNVLLPTLANCDSRCEFVDRKEHLITKRNAAAYILHGRDMDLDDLPRQSSKHLNILFLLESPYHTGSQIYRVPRNYFNATITYRQDSRYFHPYGQFQPRTQSDPVGSVITAQQVSDAIIHKKKGSLIFISNCHSPSKREKLIIELGKVTDVTVRGKCEDALSINTNTKSIYCKTDCSDDELINTHRFYIAFENSDCNDYITEKFYSRISQLLVPIVLKRRIYEAAGIPEHSYIAVDDFEDITELGNHLNFLLRNDTAYLRYFEWTKHFRKPDAYVGHALCTLCEDIYSRKKLIVSDIREFYDKDQCF